MRNSAICRTMAGVLGLVVCGLVQAAELPTAKPERQSNSPLPIKQVDFRYAIPWWQSAACLPDDPDKVLVGKEGQFLTDYTPGGKGGRSFDVFVQHDVAGGSTWVRQELHSARVPILRTIKQAGDVRIEEGLFAVIPAEDKALSEPLLRRVGGEKVVAGWDAPKVQRVLYGWAKPVVPCDPALEGIPPLPAGRAIDMTIPIAHAE